MGAAQRAADMALIDAAMMPFRTAREAVLSVVGASPMTIGEVVAATGFCRDAVGRTLRGLTADGSIRRGHVMRQQHRCVGYVKSAT